VGKQVVDALLPFGAAGFGGQRRGRDDMAWELVEGAVFSMFMPHIIP
jgi:hypothetical protein